MADGEKQSQTRFAQIVKILSKEPGVFFGKPGTTRTFGHATLTVNGKIFAMVSSKGEFVVKLPKQRVDALEAAGAGKRFDSGKRTPMKEWLQVNAGTGWSWLELAREALSFVRTVP